MKLSYAKISKDVYKFFSEDGGYGEFYIRFDDVSKVYGNAEIEMKDPDYSEYLIEKFSETMKDKIDFDKIDIDMSAIKAGL